MDEKIKILIFGASGMLGNALMQYLTKNENFEVFSTTRQSPSSSKERKFRISPESLFTDLETLLSEQFDFVINAIGVIRPTGTKEDMYDSFFVNSYFPQILSQFSDRYGTRLIHVSTDCVFTGKNGNYAERDIPDEYGIYGMSKFLGEITRSPHLTLRTSIIGRELGTQKNLIDWFLSNANGASIKGYKNVFWNGVTTIALAKIIERVIGNNLFSEGGLYQIASERISKYDLLMLVNEIYGRKIIIIPDETIVSDKTIISSDLSVRYFSDIIPGLRTQLIELFQFYSH